MPPRHLLVCAVAGLALAGCAVPQREGPSPEALGGSIPGPFASMDDYERQREAALAALDAEIGEAGAADAAACRVVAVGAKACGGPTVYRVYSATAASPARVEALARRVTALDSTAIRQFELVSTCEFLSEPEAALDDGRCVARRVD